MSGKITITNQSPRVAVVDIEGVIGVPEPWQFEEPGQRVATYETFRGVVESLRKVDAPEVIVNIRSTGGNVNDALLIFDALCSLGASVTTRCLGYVASAATIIAQAASPGRREISSGSLYLVHRSKCAAEGNTGQIMESADMLAKTDERIAELYAVRSGRPAGFYAELMAENGGNGRWLSPEETVRCGLADRITAGTAIPAAAAESIENAGLPPIPKSGGKNPVKNIAKRWNALLEALGIAPSAEGEASSDGGGVWAAGVADDMARAQLELIEAHSREVASLENRISELETQNARLAVMPTRTQPKEDPSACETRLSANHEAYVEDLRGFRE